MEKTQYLNIEKMKPLISPSLLKRHYKASAKGIKMVLKSRQIIKDIIDGKDSRFLVIVGPCSIHNESEALDYARRLAKLQKRVEQSLYIVMRTYFEKPRTSIGWKGLINDPKMDGSCDILLGLKKSREIAIQILDLGLPIATEALNPITFPYISDLMSWVAIGARTVESQPHREMASGLSMPVGFKNNTDGSVLSAINALKASSSRHTFLGINRNGKASVIKTTGNKSGHIILRGGGEETNYEMPKVYDMISLLEQHRLRTSVMIDCSHGNSKKYHQNQMIVFEEIIRQRYGGNANIIGVMLESYLEAGNQLILGNASKLLPGVSVTDACIDWDTTELILKEAYTKLRLCL